MEVELFIKEILILFLLSTRRRSSRKKSRFSFSTLPRSLCVDSSRHPHILSLSRPSRQALVRERESVCTKKMVVACPSDPCMYGSHTCRLVLLSRQGHALDGLDLFFKFFRQGLNFLMSWRFCRMVRADLCSDLRAWRHSRLCIDSIKRTASHLISPEPG